MTWKPEPKPAITGIEIVRIAASMTATCVVAALVLGATYVATARYSAAARANEERHTIRELFGLASEAPVLEVSQYLAPAAGEVVYRVAAAEGAAGRELVYTLDGALVKRGPVPAGEPPKTLQPLGRLYVASAAGRPAGFVLEGQARGYKNIIRFYVALDSSFTIQAVRVVEHEEDPGLGAETATAWFGGQYIGRRADQMDALDVTRDPMPEDWRAALATLERTPRGEWRAKQTALIARENGHPIYAVTGATISSRAVTDGIRVTVEHFRRRWALIGPELGGAS